MKVRLHELLTSMLGDGDWSASRTSHFALVN